jgi:hypothetical protein
MDLEWRFRREVILQTETANELRSLIVYHCALQAQMLKYLRIFCRSPAEKERDALGRESVIVAGGTKTDQVSDQ